MSASEFGFLKNLKSKYSLAHIGDDAAVLRLDEDAETVVSTDTLVENIDFRRSWSTPECIAHKSLAVSLSDIAAMGAKPLFSMCSLTIPKALFQSEFVDGFFSGWMELSEKYEVSLIGGDLSSSENLVVVNSTVIGECKRGGSVKRSGASVGDSFFVTGNLGYSAAGLEILDGRSEIRDFNARKEMTYRQIKPQPRVPEGVFLNSIASAMIDLSDGLSTSLDLLCSASGVGCEIDIDKLPTGDLSQFFDKRTVSGFALHGGEDFELLFTVPQEKIYLLENSKNLAPFSPIGTVTANKEIIGVTSDGQRLEIEPKGFSHF